MIRMARMVVLLLVLGPVTATAAILQSGEHGPFTRLAFLAEGPVDWVVSEDDRSIDIRFDPAPDLEIEIERIYARIDRQRIGDVAWRDGTLTLALACECTVTVADVGARQIAIDVAPSQLPPTSPPVNTRVRADRPADPVRPGLPLILPSLDIPLGTTFARAARERMTGPRMPSSPPPAPLSANASFDQILLRDGRSADIRRRTPVDMATGGRNRCDGSDVLGAILGIDTSDAWAALPDVMAGFDATQTATVTALRNAYHSAGLAREAAHLAAAYGADDQWSRLLASARGEGAAQRGDDTGRDCDAAATLLALASSPPAGRIPASRIVEMLALVAEMPQGHRVVLVPRAADHARRAGFDALAEELEARTGSVEPGTTGFDPRVHAAGLADRVLPDTQIEELTADTIADAEAVIGEVADDETRDRLQMAIIRADARNGDLPALETALDRLSTEDRQAALSALIADLPNLTEGRALTVGTFLLRWQPVAEAEARRAAAAFLRARGYASMALRWDRGDPDVPMLVDLGDTGLAGEEIAWLSRDIAAVAGSDTPRSRLAQHVMQAPTDTSVGTIEAARERIARSEAAARHVGAILDERPALETDP